MEESMSRPRAGGGRGRGTTWRTTLLTLLFAGAIGAYAVGAAAGESSGRERDANYYAAAEVVLSAATPAGVWDADKIREAVRVIGAAPEVVASQLLWQISAAPPGVDTTNFYATALGAESLAVRQVALSYLITGGNADSRRLLLNTLALENNPDTLRLMVRGIGSLPLNAAVRGLMDIMYLPGAKGLLVEEAGSELRRLTRQTIPNHPTEWRDWWLDNEAVYQ